MIILFAQLENLHEVRSAIRFFNDCYDPVITPNIFASLVVFSDELQAKGEFVELSKLVTRLDHAGCVFEHIQDANEQVVIACDHVTQGQ